MTNSIPRLHAGIISWIFSAIVIAIHGLAKYVNDVGNAYMCSLRFYPAGELKNFGLTPPLRF